LDLRRFGQIILVKRERQAGGLNWEITVREDTVIGRGGPQRPQVVRESPPAMHLHVITPSNLHRRLSSLSHLSTLNLTPGPGSPEPPLALLSPGPEAHHRRSPPFWHIALPIYRASKARNGSEACGVRVVVRIHCSRSGTAFSSRLLAPRRDGADDTVPGAEPALRLFD
jgi:hypothetical protein